MSICRDSLFLLDPIYECNKVQNGYPKNTIYEYLDVKPKPYKYDNCIPSTSPWIPQFKYSWGECKGKIYANKSGNFKLKGRVTKLSGNGVLKYWAPNPSTCLYSISGTGLPFPNEEIAFENTPNQGEIAIDATGNFEITLLYPAGYYINQGETYVPPHVNFLLCGTNKVIRVELPFDTPFRSLGSNLSNHEREWQPTPYKKPQ